MISVFDAIALGLLSCMGVMGFARGMGSCVWGCNDRDWDRTDERG